MNALRLSAGLLALALSSATVADAPPGARACMPVAEGAWIRTPPPTASVLAAYLRLRNPCAAPAALAGAQGAGFGSVMLHQTTMDGGMSRMRHAASLPIPARGVLLLAPNGAHLMLMRPARVPRAGERVRLVLDLADGRRLPVDFRVQADAPR